MPVQINIADIQRAAQNSIPLSFKLAGLRPESFPLLDRILEIFLSELGQEKIQEPLSYCLKELISNAQKANAKRIYFVEHKLDISNGYDYQKSDAVEAAVGTFTPGRSLLFSSCKRFQTQARDCG